MSGLCGWAGHPGTDGELCHLIGAMAAPLALHDKGDTALWVGDSAALAEARSLGAPQAAGAGGVAVALTGLPYWMDPCMDERARAEGGAAAILHAYRENGPDLLHELGGAFALAIIDQKKDRVLLATDRLGICPMLFHQAGECIVFGSSSAVLDVHPRAEAEIDPQAIYNYVYFAYVPAPGTIRRGRERLLPGEYALLERGRLTRDFHARVEYDDSQKTSVRRLKDELHKLLRQSIRRHAAAGRVGAFLSGGVDSSTVAGVLSEVGEGRAQTYSIGFDAEGYDELGYARIVSKHFDTDHHEYCVKASDVEALVPMIARAYPEPFGNESAVPTFFCAKMAKEDGIEHLLAGDGGDELFGGNERYAMQKLFEMYGAVPAPVRRWLIEPGLEHFPFGSRVWPVRRGRAYVRRANTPLPDRTQGYNYIEVFGADHVFEADFLAQVDPGQPMELIRAVYHGAHATSWLNRLLAVDAKFTLADVDLPKVSRMCELAGVSVSYPLLCDAIVNFAARVGVGLKVKGFKLRYFFKRAMRDFLPRETLEKRKHGFGLPFGVWLRTHKPLQVLSEESLLNLKSRRIVRSEFLDNMLHGHRTEHAAYYGEGIWHLMMLEQWFQAHVDFKSVVSPRS